MSIPLDRNESLELTDMAYELFDLHQIPFICMVCSETLIRSIVAPGLYGIALTRFSKIAQLKVKIVAYNNVEQSEDYTDKAYPDLQDPNYPEGAFRWKDYIFCIHSGNKEFDQKWKEKIKAFFRLSVPAELV